MDRLGRHHAVERATFDRDGQQKQCDDNQKRKPRAAHRAPPRFFVPDAQKRKWFTSA
jgi:hypothetical protein